MSSTIVSSPAVTGRTTDGTETPPRNRRSARRVAPQVLKHILLIIGALVSIFPFYWMFVLATHDSSAIYKFPPPLLPGSKAGENFDKVFSTVNVWAAMGNTVVVALTVTVLVVLIDSMAAFAFAKYSFRGRNLLFGVVMATFLLPSQLATIPQFLMMTEFGWVGELKAVIFPSLAGAFGIFWLRQYFQNSVQTELLEAAIMDGCGFFRQYRNVALPSARGAISFLAIFTFIGSWNDFMWPLIVLNNPDRLTLQVVLSQLQTAHGTDYGMLMMSALIAVVPLVLIFIVGAKQFIAGITEGAVK